MFKFSYFQFTFCDYYYTFIQFQKILSRHFHIDLFFEMFSISSIKFANLMMAI